MSLLSRNNYIHIECRLCGSVEMRKRSALFFNAAVVRSRRQARRVNNLPGIFFFFFYLNQFGGATATGVWLLLSLTSEVLTFSERRIIFSISSLFAVMSAKLFLVPRAAERAAPPPSPPRPPPPLHRVGVNAGATLYEWLSTRCTRCTSVIRLSCCLPTGSL